jgi:hypothetical protein
MIGGPALFRLSYKDHTSRRRMRFLTDVLPPTSALTVDEIICCITSSQNCAQSLEISPSLANLHMCVWQPNAVDLGDTDYAPQQLGHQEL